MSGLERFTKWVDDFEDATADARRLSERDRDYYDGKQWTSSELRQLKLRGQPATVVNLIQKKINFLLGAEIRTRVDPRALPRTPEHDDEADSITDAIRFVADKEQMQKTIISSAYNSMLVEGYGGAIVDIELTSKVAQTGNEADVALTPEIKLRTVPWDRVLYDPTSRRPDFADAKYKGPVVWLDHEDAVTQYAKNPHHTADFESILETTVEQGDNSSTETLDDRPRKWGDNKRKRVKIVELYYKQADDWFVCHFTGGGFVVDPQPTGLLDSDGHHECPLILASAFVNRENERYGVVRAMVSSQDEVNKRRSKALHLMSVRQVIAEEGAVQSTQTAQTELAKPDGYVEVRPGAMAEGAFQIQQTGDLAQAHFQLLSESKAEIDTLGPSLQDAAADRQVMSGRAIVARQQAATLELEPVFDSLRCLQLEVDRQIFHRIRQFWTEETWARVRDDKQRKGWRFVGLNRKMTRIERIAELVKEKEVAIPAAFAIAGWPEGVAVVEQLSQSLQAQAQQAGIEASPGEMEQIIFQQISQLPEAQEIITANDVAKIDVDIVLDVTPDTSVIQQEEFEKLATLRESGVEIPTTVLLEASQLRNKRELIEMLESAQQQDPAVAQMQQQQMAAQLALIQSQVAALQAQAQKAAAQAQQVVAETETHAAEAGAEIKKDEGAAMKSAAEAGAIVAGRDSPTTAFD